VLHLLFYNVLFAKLNTDDDVGWMDDADDNGNDNDADLN